MSDATGCGATLQPPSPQYAPRLGFVDALRAGASQLIVLHHLAFYGPMSDAAAPLAPALGGWLSEYGRLAVQAFLVLAGFLAARTLAPGGVLLDERPLRLVMRRYFRLVVPFAAALTLAIVFSAIARLGMEHDSIPAAPGWSQIAAHLLLVHDLLDYPALSAGVWYVAIDFQLFATMTLLLWLARGPRVTPASGRAFGLALVAALALASLFHFNRDARWDESALYFFGSYAVGAFACWIGRQRRARNALALLTLVVLIALMADFRSRIAVALLVALSLAASLRPGPLQRWSASPAIGYLSRIGYSLFLVHFPVLLVVGAAFHRFSPTDPWLNALGIVVAWAASIAIGALFHRYVEQPAMRWNRTGPRGAGQKTARAPAGAL